MFYPTNLSNEFIQRIRLIKPKLCRRRSRKRKIYREGLVQRITKVIIFFDMMMAIGLSQYNVALMHTVNHAFFVWQHRHFHFKYGPDLKNIFNEHIWTSIWSKFKLYLRWERLTRVNSYQNCNNVIENFYSIYLYRSDEIFIQEKINKGPNFITKFISFYIKVHHIKNKCRIERILPSYNNIIVKIVKMLKVGKQNLLNKYLRILDIFNLLIEQFIFLFGYKFSINTNINIKFSELMNDRNNKKF